jgi:hypothetical protein
VNAHNFNGITREKPGVPAGNVFLTSLLENATFGRVQTETSGRAKVAELIAYLGDGEFFIF